MADFNDVLTREPRASKRTGVSVRCSMSSKRSWHLPSPTCPRLYCLNPRDAVLLFNRANVYFMLSDYERAIADYSNVLRLEPRHAWALANRGKAIASSGDHTRAVSDFTAGAAARTPENVKLLVNRAHSYIELDAVNKALADYHNEALHRQPSAAIYLDRGLALAGRGKLEPAIADFTAALQLDPDNAPAYHFRGNAHADRDELDAALADLDEAVRLAPDQAAISGNRGNVHAARGDFDAALADLNRSLELDPQHARSCFSRGHVHAQRGEDAEALADFAPPSSSIRARPVPSPSAATCMLPRARRPWPSPTTRRP